MPLSPGDPSGRDTTADVVIIGAGIIGTAVALELSRSGYRTLNVDRLGGAGHGSTSSSAGILRTYAASPDAVVLAAEALPAWRDWAAYLDLPADQPAARLHTCGTLVLDPAPDYIAAVRHNLDAVGLPYEMWSAEDVAERAPYLDLASFGPPRTLDDPAFWDEPRGTLSGGLYLPDSGFVPDPVLATQNLASAAVRQGARFRFGTAVQAIRRSGGRVAGVELSDGTTVAAPVVVNVAGPHSARINDLAGVTDGMRVRTRPLRQELHHVPCPPQLDYTNTGLHIADADLGINFRPELGNAILVGANGAGCDVPQYVDDPADLVPTVTRPMWDTHTLRLARRIPSLGVPARPAGVAGLYDVSDDWSPIYDRSDLPGYYMAIGTSGNQFKTAPVAGRLMAALIDACEAGRDHDRDPLELPGRLGVPIKVGSYSRLREVSVSAVASVNG